MAITWAQRLKRVFNIEISVCERCSGPVRVVACVEDADPIEAILTHLQQRTTDGDIHPGRGPPQLELFA